MTSGLPMKEKHPLHLLLVRAEAQGHRIGQGIVAADGPGLKLAAKKREEQLETPRLDGRCRRRLEQRPKLLLEQPVVF